MNRQLLFIALLIALAAGLVACGGGETPAAGTTAAVATATTAVSDAGPTAGVATPTAELAPTDAPTAEPAPADTPVPAALCPDLPRPALILSTGPGFEAHNPLSGERCPLSLPETAGYVQPGGDRLYFTLTDPEAGNTVVARLGADGMVEPLETTRAATDAHYLVRYAVAADESRLAWTRMEPQADPNETALIGNMWIGANDGSEPVAVFEGVVGDQLRIVTPLRFSADSQTLFFTWEPIGLGGMWASFNGRYDNLYRVPITGGEPQKVFDCADAGLFLCLGDFRDDGTLAYIDTEKTIHVNGQDGSELAAIPSAADYAGYPTFSPAGDLYYTEATLDENPEMMPLPAPGTVYRVTAPYTGAPVVVASTDGLLTSAMGKPFLDNEHLVVSYAENEMWGTALLSVAGEIARLEPWPNAYLAAVWPTKP